MLLYEASILQHALQPTDWDSSRDAPWKRCSAGEGYLQLIEVGKSANLFRERPGQTVILQVPERRSTWQTIGETASRSDAADHRSAVD